MPTRDRDDDVDDDTPARPRKRERDDDDDDRPRKKRKKAKKPQGLTRGQKQMIIVGGIGAFVLLLILVGGVFGLLALFPKPDKTINGEGWYMGQEDVNHTVTAYFPGGKPQYEKHGMKVPAALAQMSGATSEELSWNVRLWETKHKGREYSMFLWTFPSKGADPGLMERTVLGQRLPEPGGGVTQQEERISVNDKPARRVVVQGPKGSAVYITMATADNQMFSAAVSGPGKFDHTDPMVQTFFDNLTVK